MTSTEDATPTAPVAEQQSFTSAEVAGSLFGCPLYGMYIQWQRTINDPKEARYYASPESYIRLRDSVRQNAIGDLPTPHEYISFMGRIKPELFEMFAGRAEKSKGQTEVAGLPELVVASLCGHMIHPGNPCVVPDLCPVCVMWQCTNSLFRIAQVWRQLGGPYRIPNTPEIIKLYTTVKRIWYLEKNRWSNLVFKYDSFTVYEREWEARNQELSPQAREAIQDTQSCTVALTLARQVPFLVDGWGKKFVRSEKCLNTQSTVRELMHQQTLGVDELPSSPPLFPESIADMKESDDSIGTDWKIPQSPQREHKTPTKTPMEDCPPSPTIKSPISPKSPSSTHSYNTSRASSSEFSPPPPPSSPNLSERSHRQVTFAADVQDSKSRPAGRFKRKSTFYQPGKYACPPESAWIDTSFSSDAMYEVFGNEDEEKIELVEIKIKRVATYKGTATAEERIPSNNTEGFRIWQDTEHDLDPAAGLAVWNPIPPSSQQEFPDAMDPTLLFDGYIVDDDVLEKEMRAEDEIDATMHNAETDGAHVHSSPFSPPSARHTHPLSETQTANVNGSPNHQRKREEFEQMKPPEGEPEAKRHCRRYEIV